ncbi:tRNA pseudouridine(13) synthase TruD [Cellvibrio sp. OA-2007]|uniref:tRNA pseudouridine(13) synthase TruD n=1 Tax=Cellvibrio sp. OA-2007 TaxID=529823 RepID=UPI00078595B5|nr:tRNA pseudouridine(13) synthase TruD [Cellvibrio sp. OA-2007]
MTDFSLEFPRAHGALTATAIFRAQPEDFQVDEELGYVPSGSGEHVFLHVCKRGENTAWVAGKIAELAGVNVTDVGYCGRKDRHAVTAQWFSVYLPKAPEPDWTLLNTESIQLLSVSRHQTKLRRGEHQQNNFVIRLRNVQTDDRSLLQQKIDSIFTQGVPNYFGEQRFGLGGNNLQEAEAILVGGKRYRDKQKRGLMLSAARSYLFNQVLAARVLANNWANQIDGEINPNPSGPLWGRGRPLVSGALLELEQNALADWAAWCDGLEHAGLSQERRALQLIPRNARSVWEGDDLILYFSLDAGEFATAILHEFAVLQNQSFEPTISSV